MMFTSFNGGFNLFICKNELDRGGDAGMNRT